LDGSALLTFTEGASEKVSTTFLAEFKRSATLYSGPDGRAMKRLPADTEMAVSMKSVFDSMLDAALIVSTLDVQDLQQQH
jgi:hypothetical protein